MKHRPRSPERADPTRPRLLDMIDMRHELVRLAALIDWSWFEEHWAGFFPSPEGRPALHPRLVAGLMYLQHAYGLSDEAVLARCGLKGLLGDAVFAVLCGCGHNIRKLLAHLRALLAALLASLLQALAPAERHLVTCQPA